MKEEEKKKKKQMKQKKWWKITKKCRTLHEVQVSVAKMAKIEKSDFVQSEACLSLYLLLAATTAATWMTRDRDKNSTSQRERERERER